MFFTMVDHIEDGVTYSRRVGVMTPSFKKAKEKAIKKHGYIVDESNNIIAQAMSEHLPKYIGDNGSINSLRNIGSGEDCYV